MHLEAVPKQVVLVWQSLSLKTSNHEIKVIWQFENLAVTKYTRGEQIVKINAI